MSSGDELSWEATCHVRETCLCVRVQRAARALARYFDDALRPVGLTHGQFSLLVALNQTEPPIMSEVSTALAMDRTTLTANLKPLQRRGLVEIAPDPKDRRARLLSLTEAGRSVLASAVPVWTKLHGAIERELADAQVLRAELNVLSGMRRPGVVVPAGEPVPDPAPDLP